MSEFTQFLLVARLLPLLAGAVMMYMGYKLFLRRIIDRSHGEVSIEGLGKILVKGAPGLIFLIVGAVIVIWTVARGMRWTPSEWETNLIETEERLAAADDLDASWELRESFLGRVLHDRPEGIDQEAYAAATLGIARGLGCEEMNSWLEENCPDQHVEDGYGAYIIGRGDYLTHSILTSKPEYVDEETYDVAAEAALEQILHLRCGDVRELVRATCVQRSPEDESEAADAE